MSAEATGYVWRNSTHKGLKLLVHLAVADVVNDAHDNRFWMTSTSLAEKVRASESAVRRIMGELVDEGSLERLDAGGGRSRPSTYRFVFARTVAREHGSSETVARESETVATRDRQRTQENSNSVRSKVSRDSKSVEQHVERQRGRARTMTDQQLAQERTVAAAAKLRAGHSCDNEQCEAGWVQVDGGVVRCETCSTFDVSA